MLQPLVNTIFCIGYISNHQALMLIRYFTRSPTFVYGMSPSDALLVLAKILEFLNAIGNKHRVASKYPAFPFWYPAKCFFSSRITACLDIGPCTNL
jgi:hypothetical protein